MAKANTLHVWIRGLIAACISGGSGAVTASLGANMIAPDVFNLDAGLGKMVQLAAMMALVGAVNGVAAYLKQSPLPPPEGGA